MARFTSPLDQIKVSAPCSADWDSMIGTDKIRFCNQCNLNVYNLSGMTKDEAENLVMNAEGRLCARFYKRADGTLLTENCPVGLKAIKRKVAKVTTAVLSTLLSFFAGLGLYAAFKQDNTSTNQVRMGKIAKPEPVQVKKVREEGFIMGDVALPVDKTPVKCETKGSVKRTPLPIVGNVVLPIKAESELKRGEK
jgi:hypothetical protein